jgi:hypothetical protein
MTATVVRRGSVVIQPRALRAARSSRYSDYHGERFSGVAHDQGSL